LPAFFSMRPHGDVRFQSRCIHHPISTWGNKNAVAKKIKIPKRHTELPVPTHFVALDTILHESDRGAAVVGTAYLDLLLRGALEHQMRTDADVLEALFTNNGALQDFSARIKIAYAFKIIGPGAYADLNLLREIRNAFAHSAQGLSFKSPDVAAICNRLWYPLAPMITYGKGPRPTEPKDIFVQAVKMLADGLYRSMGPHPDSFIQWGPVREVTSPTSPKKPKLRPSRGRPEKS